MRNGDVAVIVDFDSCQPIGKDLGRKAGTEGWTGEQFTCAQLENDYFEISKIQKLAARKQERLKGASYAYTFFYSSYSTLMLSSCLVY